MAESRTAGRAAARLWTEAMLSVAGAENLSAIALKTCHLNGVIGHKLLCAT
jgi:hypothetical protein